jgi:hypothetical protein
MLSYADRSHDPATHLPGGSAALRGLARLAEGALHVAAVLSLGMLAVACAVLGLIWFSMGLPNG